MRVGLVGLGNAAQQLHLPALAALEDATVVGGCDPDPNRRRAAVRRWGVPGFESFEALIAETRPDVVVVGTPPDTHAAYCLTALEAGAHVICEKPFVSDLDEADRVIRAAARAKRQVAVNHEFRELPIFRALLEEVSANRAGRPHFVQLWQLMDLPPWKEPGWRGRLLNRTLFEAGVHLVDLLIALFGEKPGAVTAHTSSCGASESPSDAVALATFEFSGGRLGHVLQDRLCRGATQYFEARVDCEAVSLRASFGGRARLSTGLYRAMRPHFRLEYGISGLAWREEGTRRKFLARNPRNPAMVATRRVFRRTLKAFRAGSLPPVTMQDARDGLEAIAAAYRSAELGRRVDLSADAGLVRELTMGEGGDS